MVGLMDADQVKVGMKVHITSIETTHKLYSSCPSMQNMVGNICSVDSKKTSQKYPSKTIIKLSKSFYQWAPEDLNPAEVINEIKGGKFNVENLVV
jgi:hypothetical protein